MLGTLNPTDRLQAPVQSGDPPGAAPRGTRSRLGRAYVAASVAMIPWLLYLAFTLPASATAGHWALAWVGLDSCEALALLATGRLLLRADNRSALAATAAAVLLLTDAWLDVTSAASGNELLTAITMAVFAEVPIALACIALALRLIRHPFPSAGEVVGAGGTVEIARVAETAHVAETTETTESAETTGTYTLEEQTCP